MLNVPRIQEHCTSIITNNTHRTFGCDHNYKFTLVDIGSIGKNKDEAFLIRKHLMWLYSERYLEERKNIFNYRLSRARRTIENTLGILAKKVLPCCT
ncbi:hypothetical protein ACFW04_014238 [Cataglyphis niger]